MTKDFLFRKECNYIDKMANLFYTEHKEEIKEWVSENSLFSKIKFTLYGSLSTAKSNNYNYIELPFIIDDIVYCETMIMDKNDKAYSVCSSATEKSGRRINYEYCITNIGYNDRYRINGCTFMSGIVCPLYLDEYKGIDMHQFGKEKVNLDKLMFEAENESGIIREDKMNAAMMKKVLGVNKDDLEMIKKFRITDDEYIFIANNKIPKNEELYKLVKKCKIKNQPELRNITATQFLRYYPKVENQFRGVTEFSYAYRDYIDMAIAYNLNLKDKSIKFPLMLKEKHDELLDRKRKDKDEYEVKLSENAKERIAKIDIAYNNGEYAIIVPYTRAELIREGENLHICVGNIERYYINHCTGDRNIVFVRAAKEIDKSLYCCEMNLSERRIVQLNGKNNEHAPEDVRNFVTKYMENLKGIA